MKRKSHKALGCKANSWKFCCKQNKKKKEERKNIKLGRDYTSWWKNMKKKNVVSPKYLQPKKEESSKVKPTKPKCQSENISSKNKYAHTRFQKEIVKVKIWDDQDVDKVINESSIYHQNKFKEFFIIFMKMRDRMIQRKRYGLL